MEHLIFKKYNLLSKREGLDDFDLFIDDYESFDEIPLISRISNIKILEKSIPNAVIQDALINLSFFYINNIYFYAKSKLNEKQFNSFFSCLTFDLSDIDFFDLYIPNILVTRKIWLFKFIPKLKRINSSRKKNTYMLPSFSRLNLEKSFFFFEEKKISNESVSRIFAVPSAHFSRLEIS